MGYKDNLFFKSKLYRETIKHWALVMGLFLWATVATTFAFQNRAKIVLIGIDESGTRLITQEDDKLLRSELKNFLKYFVESFYSYNDQDYLAQMSKATDIMTDELWQNKKEEILALDKKLKTLPLSQFATVNSIDLIDAGNVEATVALTIKSRLGEKKVQIKSNIRFNKTKRSENNPWGYEIQDVTDAIL